MSIFGSSTKTYYSSTSIKLFEDVPGIVKQTVGSSITQNRNIADDLITNLVNGVFYKANGLYNYGKSGGYPWGLPDGSFSVLAANSPIAVQRVIEKEITQYIDLGYVSIAPDTTTDHMIYTAEYRIKDVKGNLGETVYTWTYDERTGVYPELNLPIDDVANVSPYYPIIPLRVNNVDYTKDTHEHYNSVRRAGRHLGLDTKDIGESLEAQSEDGDNPVEDAYIVLGVEVTTDVPEGMQYLFNYFSHMHGVATVTEQDYLYWETNSWKTETYNDEYGFEQERTYRATPPPVNLVNLSDANYKVELGWLYSKKTLKTGTIDVTGKIGTYTTGYTTGSNIPFGNTSGFFKTGYVSSDIFTIKKQVTANQYIEINVHGLVHSNWAIGKELRTTLSSAFNDPDDVAQSFTIPLRRDIAKPLGAVKQHDLLQSSIRLVVNDVLKVKLKWYQTGIFQVLVLVAAIAISIFFPPFGIAAMSAMAVGVAVAMVVTMHFLMPFAVKALADLVGEELALVIAVVASFFMGGGGLNGALSAGLTAVGGATNIIMGDLLADELKDLEGLQEANEDLLEEQREAEQKILQTKEMTEGDSYAIMDTPSYVKKFKYSAKLPTMITATTEHFTGIMQFTDRPDSYIRLGN
jgi:hypothetical protein